MNNKVLEIVDEYYDYAHFCFVYQNNQIYNDVFIPNFRTWFKICLIPIYLLFCISFNFFAPFIFITVSLISIIQICLIPFSYIKFPKFILNIRKLFYKN